jgi:hypothetical protein
MPLTRADRIQIDEYIQAGQIHNARRMLQESDDPKAAAALAKLNQQYPPTATRPVPPPAIAPTPVKAKVPPVLASPTLTDLAPDMPHDEMTDVRLAIKERRYDDARSLLVLSSHPDADKMLERLSHLGGGEKAKRVYEDEGKDFSGRLSITIFLLIFLTLFGLIALAVWLPDARRYPNAPGSQGLIRANQVVTLILRGIIVLLLSFIALNVITFLVRPRF